MRKQFLAVLCASLMVGVLPYKVNALSSTTVVNYPNQSNVQVYDLSTDNGGTLTVGAGSGAGISGFSGYYDSTTKAEIKTIGGVTEFPTGVIYSSTGTLSISTVTFPGVLQVSTITAASTNFRGSITLPANYLVAGRQIRYTVLGTLSTPGMAGGTTMLWAVKLGTTTIGSTGNIVWPAGLSSMTFTMNGILACQAAGTFVGGVSSATTNFMINVASGTTQAPAGVWTVGNSTTNVAQINTTQAMDFNIVVGYQSTSAGTVFVPTSIVYEDLN